MLEAKQSLTALLQQSPTLAGLARSRWWLGGVQQVVDWLRSVSLAGIWGILKRFDLHYKRGRQYVHSPDLDYQAKVSQITAAIQQVSAQPERYVLVYEDEFTYYRRPSLANAYGQAGQDDIRAHSGVAGNTKRRIAACLNLLTGQVHAWQRASFRRRTLLRYFLSLAAAYPHADTIFVVLDNWPVHFHPDVLQGLLGSRLVFLRLPTYAPWLNPIEKL